MKATFKTVVRVKTQYYSIKTGAVLQRTITTLKRKSYGYDLLNDEISAEGATSILPRIVNLDTVADGVYELISTNHSFDSYGEPEDYDFKLISYKEDKE